MTIALGAGVLGVVTGVHATGDTGTATEPEHNDTGIAEQNLKKQLFKK